MSKVASGGASREIVVFPAPETPANKNALPLRTALAECRRNPPCLASTSVCTMRSTASMEYGLADWRIQPRREAGLPLGTEIAALEQPAAGLQRDAHIGIGIHRRRGNQIHVELELGGLFPADFAADKTGVPVLQHLQK